MAIKKLMGMLKIDEAAKAATKSFNKGEFYALVSFAAAVAASDGSVDDSERTSFIEDCKNLPWMKSFSQEEILKEFDETVNAIKQNSANAKLEIVEKLAKIKDAGISQRILGTVCNIAAADGNFDPGEIHLVRELAKNLPLENEEISRIIAEFASQVEVDKADGKQVGGWV